MFGPIFHPELPFLETGMSAVARRSKVDSTPSLLISHHVSQQERQVPLP